MLPRRIDTGRCPRRATNPCVERGLIVPQATALKRALGISTIGDLADNRFVHAAQIVTGRGA
jgi:hypothetical protein